jgi:hypothetical protein
MHQSSRPNAPQSKRLQQLAAAFDACRRGNRGRRLPPGLRAQVVAAVEAGASKSAVGKACNVSWSQITGWQQAAARNARVAPAASEAASASPRVLSVVDRVTPQDTLLDDEIELRIGGWHVSLRRVAP